MRSKSEHHIWWQLRCLQLTTAQTFRQCAYGLRGDGADFSRKFWGPEPDFYIDLRRSQTNRNCQSQTFWQPPTSGLFWKAPSFFLHLEKLPHDPPQSLGSTESRHRACHRWTFLGMTCHLFRRCGPVSILFLCRWDGPHGHLQFAFPNLFMTFMTSQADFLLQKSFLFSRLLRSFPGHRFGCTTTSLGSQDMPCKCSTSWDPVIKGMYCSGWSWMVQSFGGHNLPCDRTCLVFSLPTKACASQSTS